MAAQSANKVGDTRVKPRGCQRRSSRRDVPTLSIVRQAAKTLNSSAVVASTAIGCRSHLEGAGQKEEGEEQQEVGLLPLKQIQADA